jgi:hypothetical protein
MIYVATEQSMEAGAEVTGTLKALPWDAGAFFKDGVKWERTSDFEGQYFAFGVGRSGTGKLAKRFTAGDCSWKDMPPESLDGMYFVGVSRPIGSEQDARKDAMKAAKEAIISFLGEYMSQESQTNEKLAGVINAVGGEVNQQTTKDSIAQGISRLVKDEAWCMDEPQETPDGYLRVARVLTFFPNSERAAAMRVQMTTLRDILKNKGKLTADAEKAMNDAIAQVK